MGKKQQVQVNINSWSIALASARSMRIAAERQVGSLDLSQIELETALTVSVLYGLSIELYLKSFMIGARSGLVTKGHKLAELYNEFPSFFKDQAEMHYKSHDISNMKAMAIAISTVERSTDHLPKSFENDIFRFEGALADYSGKFVEARYYFETINDTDWSVFFYFHELPQIITDVLDKTMEDYINGRLANTG